MLPIFLFLVLLSPVGPFDLGDARPSSRFQQRPSRTRAKVYNFGDAQPTSKSERQAQPALPKAIIPTPTKPRQCMYSGRYVQIVKSWQIKQATY